MIYPGTCRNLSAAQIAERSLRRAPALRLRVPEEEIGFTDGHLGAVRENLAVRAGTFFLRRSDGMFAYRLRWWWMMPPWGSWR